LRYVWEELTEIVWLEFWNLENDRQCSEGYYNRTKD